MNKISIYSDGASRGNPGRGGYGTILLQKMDDGKIHKKEISRGYRLTTNNRMEILGALVGLEVLTEPCEVDLYTDSQYLCNTIKKRWIYSWEKNEWKKSDGSPVKNVDLLKDLMSMLKMHKVNPIWVKGHNGNIFNERCDKLATDAADDIDNLFVDEVYEKNN